MALLFQPALYDGSTVQVLPQPIQNCQIPFQWKFKEQEVPRKAGKSVYGRAGEASNIVIDGEFARLGTSGDLLNTEDEMWDEVEALRDYLDGGDGNGEFEFFWFYQSGGSPEYRKFKHVVPRLYVPQIGDQAHTLFSYHLVLTPTTDLTVYTTAPGV